MKPAISLLLICAVITAALAFTNAITIDQIKVSEASAAKEAMEAVLSSADRFEAIESLDGISEDKPGLITLNEAYNGFKGDALEGYVFQVVTKGYGGDINVTVGVNKDGQITGVNVGNNSETPGLGKKAEDPQFKSQMEGIVPNGPLVIVKSAKSKPEEIEAISGATITSTAVVKAVQAAMEAFSAINEKGGA